MRHILIESSNTIPVVLDYFVNKYKNKLLFQRRDGWSWKQLTWLDFDTEIKNLSSFFISLDFKTGNYAVIISSNNNECVFSELAIYYLGGTVIPFKDMKSFTKYRDSVLSFNPKLLFIENSKFFEEIRKDNHLYNHFEKIFIFNDMKIGENEKVIPYKGLVKFGQLKKKEFIDTLKSNSQNVDPEQAALKLFSVNGTLQYGETEITQKRIVEILRACQRKLCIITGEDQSYSYLEASSIFEKLINLLGLTLGMRLIIAEDNNSFYPDILEAKPTVLFESCTGIEKIYSNFKSNNRTNDLRDFLGGRMNYLITESMPEKQIEDSFRRSGIEIIELPELKDFT